MASPDATTWDSTRASTASFQDGSGAPLHIGGAQPAIGDIGGIVLSNGKLRLFSNYNVSNIVFYDRVSP